MPAELAAPRTLILCRLVQTCKHLQLNQFVYLHDIIERVAAHPAHLPLEPGTSGVIAGRSGGAAGLVPLSELQ